MLSHADSAARPLSSFGALSVAAIVYGSTNFDNLVILSAYGARPGCRTLLVELTFLGVCA